MSYSQHGEDAFVMSMFHHDFKGTVLEIGAFQAKFLSNSRLFIESDWKAILVEPSPAPVRDLLREYSSNPNVTIYAAAMGLKDYWQISRFSISDGPLSTDVLAAWKFWGAEGAFFATLMVPVLPAWFFKTEPIDFLSVDTEGNSAGVLSAMLGWIAPAARLPKVICVERDDADPQNLEIQAIANRHGYEIVHHQPSDGVNRILRRKT